MLVFFRKNTEKAIQCTDIRFLARVSYPTSRLLKPSIHAFACSMTVLLLYNPPSKLQSPSMSAPLSRRFGLMLAPISYLLHTGLSPLLREPGLMSKKMPLRFMPAPFNRPQSLANSVFIPYRPWCCQSCGADKAGIVAGAVRQKQGIAGLWGLPALMTNRLPATFCRRMATVQLDCNINCVLRIKGCYQLFIK